MRFALTTRSGPSTNPLIFRIEQSGWDQLPIIGTQICANGPGGWSYFGTVTEHGMDGVHYTVTVKVAANKRLDNIRAWSGAGA